jgi:pentapeptide MXKDX repeat protein
MKKAFWTLVTACVLAMPISVTFAQEMQHDNMKQSDDKSGMKHDEMKEHDNMSGDIQHVW